MKKIISAILLVVFLLAAQSVFAKPATRRITFRPGATHATVTGRLRGIRDVAWFVIRARRGQHMTVNIDGAGATRGVVYFPNGGQDGGPGGTIFDDTLPANGDYRIRVNESQMAEAWRGKFKLRVSIK